ncbi:PAS domain S-box protein [Actinoplanes sp. NEAU-A11]|uniref:histidine kinase n=1 Tax=Actinoplanes aureus TaxID=2792083 RepID=A0A931G1L8_9ACTN|nr:PAS domain S-box protein [Actinoplanes aureus]
MSLDLVLDTALEAFIAIDSNQRVTYWNPAAEQTFGYSLQEAIGQPVDELIIPETHRAAHRAGVARMVAGHPGTLLGQRLHLPARHRDGHRLYIELTFAPVTTDDGLQFYAFAHDITEQHRAERFRGCQLAVGAALSQAHDTSQAADAVLEAIAISLQWPYAELWTPAEQEQLLECTARWSAPGRDFTAFHADNYPRGAGAPWLVWESGEPLWIPNLATDGRSPRSALADRAGLHATLLVPVRSGTTNLGVLAFFGEEIEDPADILMSLLNGIAAQLGQYLERRRAEELEVELSRTKEHFIAVITHELRNPLAAVAGNAYLILDDADDLPSQHRDSIEVIARNAERMSGLIDDLLDHRQLESGQFALHFEPVDLCEVLQEALADIQAAADGKRLTFAISLPLDAIVNGDRTRLRQVADNLIGNAVKYTPEGGRIAVTVIPQEDHITCTISDTGIGIPPAERHRIFTPFYRATTALTSDRPGTGLGLAVTKALIEHHCGTIDYTSDGAHGTTFTVTLPRAFLPAGQDITDGSDPARRQHRTGPTSATASPLPTQPD